MHLFVKVIQVCPLIIATHLKVWETFRNLVEDEHTEAFLRVAFYI